jgi:hypothetical protein
MAVRGDEVAGSIDGLVRESIQRMVGEIQSSIEDVRSAVDSQLKAALQSVQADVNAITFLPQIKKSIEGLRDEISAAAPAAAATADASLIKRALQSVERGKSQVDVLNSLLEQCQAFGSRAALLILRGDTFSGWKGVGFAAHGGNDESIKRFNAAPGAVPELDDVLRNERVVEWNGANLSQRLGVAPSTRAVLVPMVIKDKVAAAVYVDAIGDDDAKLDRASIEILVFTTGLLVDTLAIRKKIPSPSLSDESDARPSAPPAPAAASSRPAQAPAPAARPTPQPAPAPAPVQRPESTVAFTPAQMRDMVGATAKSGPQATNFSPAAPAAAPAAARPAGEERVSTQYVPPSSAGRGMPAPGAGGEDAKKHDEARRFARLLVSEIKLYNESKVEAGRKNRDLYERMKEDIDRSRQMYDERITEDIRKVSNYFYDELVRILADGNADALGL